MLKSVGEDNERLDQRVFGKDQTLELKAKQTWNTSM